MVSNKRITVNVHIEKTAGTSLLQFFEYTLGRNRIAFYDPTTDRIIKVSDLFLSPSNGFVDTFQLKSYAFWPYIKKAYFGIQTVKRQKNSIPNNIAVIHGHFKADRFDTLLPNAINTVVIRDPLKRMHSQYDHWKRAKGRSQWRVMVPYDPRMTFEQYAMLPIMQNYQVQACAGKDLKSFTVVGITERLDMFTKTLYSLFVSEGYIPYTVPFNGIKNMNQHRNTHEIKTNGFEKAFYLFHKDDYDLYEHAKSLVK